MNNNESHNNKYLQQAMLPQSILDPILQALEESDSNYIEKLILKRMTSINSQSKTAAVSEPSLEAVLGSSNEHGLNKELEFKELIESKHSEAGDFLETTEQLDVNEMEDVGESSIEFNENQGEKVQLAYEDIKENYEEEPVGMDRDGEILKEIMRLQMGEREEGFIEDIQSVKAINDYKHTDPILVKDLIRSTIFVRNLGDFYAVVKLQISPNKEYYIDDSAEIIISPSQAIILPIKTYSKYLRVWYRTLNPPLSSDLEIILQGRK